MTTTQILLDLLRVFSCMLGFTVLLAGMMVFSTNSGKIVPSSQTGWPALDLILSVTRHWKENALGRGLLYTSAVSGIVFAATFLGPNIPATIPCPPASLPQSSSR